MFSSYRFDIEYNVFSDIPAIQLINNFKVQLNQNNNYDYYSSGNKVKNAAYSLIIPGLGQYRNGDMKKAFVYMGLEIFGWAAYLNYNAKFDKEKSDYQNYASYDSKNWTFEHWINNYDYYRNNENFNYIWQDDDGNWVDIGEGSHYIEFSWCPTNSGCQNVRSNDEEFGEIMSQLGNSPDMYNDFSFEVLRDHHFYENIGKYNEFFMGWADSDDPNSIWEESSENGYIYPMSNKKTIYLNSYNKAEDYADYSEYAINVIFLNHVISMIDAFFSTKSVSISSELTYNNNFNYGYPYGYRCTLGIKL